MRCLCVAFEIYTHPSEGAQCEKKWNEREMKRKSLFWLIHVNKKIYHNEYGSDFDYPT